MKGYRILLLLGFSMFGMLNAQTFQIMHEPRVIDFPDPVYAVYTPSNTPSFEIFEMFYLTESGINKPVIIRSPISYNAFFCKMEVATQQKFGIMLKIHAGDYDSYMDQKIPK